MGLLPPGTSIEVQQDLSQPGIRVQFDEVTWTVRPDRIVVESETPGTDCGTPLSKLLSHLVWTPVFAVGVNVVFAGDDIDEATIPDGFRLPNLGFETTQRTVHASVIENESILNVQLAASKTQEAAQYELSLNIHTDFSEKKSKIAQSTLNHAASEACRQFTDGITKITDFSKKLCPLIQFSYDKHDECISNDEH